MRWLCLLLCLVLPGLAFGQESIADVSRLVSDMCRGSSVSGSKSEGGKSTKLNLPGSKKSVEFSEAEWDGIQQVLREHQAQDNAGYRDCVKELTPQFLEAYRATRQRVVEERRQAAANPDTAPLVCDYENDGQCDVPDLCPEGTDLTDCQAPREKASLWDPSDVERQEYCPFENDGTCDAPGLCPEGTDLNDCRAATDTATAYCPYENDGTCDVPGLCPAGTDLADCAPGASQQTGLYCDYENDGTCDVPDLCPYGTDLYDCSQTQMAPNPTAFQPQMYCCDYYGNKWCPMVMGASVPGAPCVCGGVIGQGVQCY